VATRIYLVFRHFSPRVPKGNLIAFEVLMTLVFAHFFGFYNPKQLADFLGIPHQEFYAELKDWSVYHVKKMLLRFMVKQAIEHLKPVLHKSAATQSRAGMTLSIDNSVMDRFGKLLRCTWSWFSGRHHDVPAPWRPAWCHGARPAVVERGAGATRRRRGGRKEPLFFLSVPTTNGKRQMLPSPTADPAVASKNPSRESNLAPPAGGTLLQAGNVAGIRFAFSAISSRDAWASQDMGYSMHGMIDRRRRAPAPSRPWSVKPMPYTVPPA
jgi:hypothetical protein